MLFSYLATVLFLLLKIFSLWFIVTALMFWKRPARYNRRDPKTRFACLIPARNESAVIAALVQSLRNQHYPDDLYDIYVMPNNCTDDTEVVASEAGAKIFRCRGLVKCKGDVLHQTIEGLLPLNYDAFCIFDADNVAHPDYLARMNDAILSGARVAKAKLRVKNPRDSWVSGCYGLYFCLNDTFFSRSRANLGLSAKLVGTGVAIHRSVLERMGGWNTVTIAEDAEFSSQCAELGERVYWVPGAITYDEAPSSFRVSLMQRRRWLSGIMSTAEVMLPRLMRAPAHVSTPRLLDMCMFLIAPFAQAVSLMPLVLQTVAACVQDSLLSFGGTFSVALMISFVGTGLFAGALRLISTQKIRLSSILLFPLFMASFLPLQILSLLRRTTDWKVIHHSRNVEFA